MKTRTHMPFRKAITGLSFAFAFTGLLSANAGAQSFPASCNVSQINISTGVNHLSGGTLYPYSGAATVVDPYWKVTMVPTNTVGITAPFCAYLTDSSLATGSGVWGSATTPGSRWISLAAKPTTTDLGSGSGFFWQYNYSSPYGPVNNANPIRFTRKFYVNGSTAQNVTVNLSAGFGDDIVFAAFDATTPIFNTPSNPKNIYYNSTYSTTYGIPATTVTVALAPGMHTLDVDLYDISGNITGINVMGTLSCSGAALIDNICYGVDSSCAGIPPSGTCDDLCYWRVTGNNITGTNNIFGTLSKHDVRIRTSAADRGIITADGRLGWSTMAPSTLLHVYCSKKYNAPSDIRFERLPSGTGRVLVIDAQGYVYASDKLQAREAGSPDLGAEVAALREELAMLKQQLGITVNTAQVTDVMLYPNPARNNLDVRFTADNIPAGEMVIMDVQGRRLQAATVAKNSKELSLNISSLPAGVYVANLVVEGKTMVSKKFVVEK